MSRHIWLFLALFSAVVAQTPGFPQGGGPCSSDWDCSLGGICNHSACVCDPWFTGATCALLNLKPANPDNGLQVPSYFSWGGHAVEVNDTFHGYFSFMCRHATLSEWTTKSSIWHATSSHPEGPYQLADMVAQPWSHNAMISQAPTGTLVLFQLGDATTDPSEWSPCYESSDTHAPLPVLKEADSSNDAAGNSGLYVRSAPTPYGPWTPLNNNTAIVVDSSNSWASGGPNGANPAPFFFPNGTVLLYFSANPCPPDWGNISPGNNCIGVARADSWEGPYSVSAANKLPVTHPESEDPFVFQDPRGNFHLLTNVNNDHTRCAQGVPCGGHAWSTDGLHFSNLTIGAFGPVIRFENGTVWENAYVERPQVTQSEDGTPLAFFVGMGRSNYYDSISWAQLFCTPGAEGCGPTIFPPPVLVRYQVGSQCLVTNSTFPCPGGWGNSCPVFLGECTAPESVWQEAPGSMIENVANPGNCINIDCNSCLTHTVAKLFQCASASPLSFTGGALVLAGACQGMCLDDGSSGPATPPCKPGEEYLPLTQLTIAPCSQPNTQRWVRSVVVQ